jgi:hypothetical protein
MARPRLILPVALAFFAAALPAAPASPRSEPAVEELRAAGAAFTDRATAEAALAHRFTLQGVTATQPLRPDGAGYDWAWRGPRDDPEWAWFFNRHHWFPALLAAYQETGDTRHAAALLATLDDWIATHPPPGRITFDSAWRPLEAARRLLHSWLPITTALPALPGATPELLARFEGSLVAHGEHLAAHHTFGGNHLVTEMLALTRLALARPDLPGAGRWLAYGLNQLALAYDEQVYPDGAHAELSTHYQRVVALNYQSLLDQLRAAGRAELAAAWEPRVARLWAYVATVMTPSGANPLNNDSDREDYRGLLASHAPALVDPARAPRTTHLPWAGQTVWREAHATAPRWAFFEAGPRGIDHEHADHLQLNLSLGADDFLVDSGRYTYAPGPWRDYFAGPTGHNVLLLDGRGSEPRPRRVSTAPAPPRFREEHGLAYAWGDATFSAPGQARAADWRRLVLHAPGAGWLVADRVIGFGPRTLTTQWHWAPTVSAAPASPRWTARAATAALSVHGPADGAWSLAHGLELPAPRGWFSPTFNRREAAAQTDFVQTLRGPRLNLWLFRPADAPADLAAEALDTRRVLLRIGTDTWILDLDGPALLPSARP